MVVLQQEEAAIAGAKKARPGCPRRACAATMACPCGAGCHSIGSDHSQPLETVSPHLGATSVCVFPTAPKRRQATRLIAETLSGYAPPVHGFLDTRGGPALIHRRMKLAFLFMPASA